MTDSVTRTDELGTVIDTDVLILGGGLAGIFAGYAASEQGCSVLLVDKAHVERSGEAGAGNDHFSAQYYTDPNWDTDIEMAAFLDSISFKFNSPEKMLNISRLVPRVREDLERMGIEYHRDPQTGEYMRTAAFGAKGPYFFMIKGPSAKKLKPTCVKALKEKGVKMLNRVMATKILIRDGQVAGATGFNVRSGEFYTLRAKTMILATGNVSRTGNESFTRNPFNIWRSPYNTGDGHAMAWRAGVELDDMGVLGVTLMPKGFGTPGVCALIGMGARLINALGEPFMHKYSPDAENAERSLLVLGMYREIQEGRGPCYFDLRHLPPDTIEFVRKNLLSVDRDTFEDFLIQKDLDPAKEPMEYEVGELAKWCGGIATNAQLETNIPGIFATGQCGVGDSFPIAGASGYLAGANAAKACQKISALPQVDPEEVVAERRRVFAPLERTEGIKPKHFEDMVRQVNETYFGMIRNEQGLKAGLNNLRKLKKYVEQIKAENCHELMRANEATNLLLCSELIALSSLERKESRFGACFMRSDYPETNPDLHGMLIMKQVNGEIVKRFEPIDPDGYDKLRSAQ